MVRSTETLRRRPAEPAGATAGTAGARARRFVPIAVVVLVVALVLLLVSRWAGSDDEPAGAATAGPRPTADPFRPATAEDGSIVAEGATLLPLAPAVDSASGVEGEVDGPTLAAFSGMAASGTRVRVESVPADEGFWVGSAKDDRVWVQLTGPAGESPVEVERGERVSFRGTVTDLPDGFAAENDMTRAEGSALLAAEGQYVAVPRSELTVHR